MKKIKAFFKDRCHLCFRKLEKRTAEIEVKAPSETKEVGITYVRIRRLCSKCMEKQIKKG